LLLRHLENFSSPHLTADEFLRVRFTHQYTIIAQEKSIQGRFFYISRCAAEFWSVEALKANLRGDLYSKSGALPNNFLQTLPEWEQARRAIRAFKDEYMLDFINIEDENDPDEYVRQPDEAPSIGIVLCKEASRNTVEFAVRDYTKPMGVATYRTRNEMPEQWQKALPDVEDMKKLLDGAETDGYKPPRKPDENFV
jgi:hypothetical protein